MVPFVAVVFLSHIEHIHKGQERKDYKKKVFGGQTNKKDVCTKSTKTRLQNWKEQCTKASKIQ